MFLQWTNSFGVMDHMDHTNHNHQSNHGRQTMRKIHNITTKKPADSWILPDILRCCERYSQILRCCERYPKILQEVSSDIGTTHPILSNLDPLLRALQLVLHHGQGPGKVVRLHLIVRCWENFIISIEIVIQKCHHT